MLIQKKCWSKKVGPKKCWSKNFCFKKKFGKKNLVQKKFWSKKNLVRKNFGPRKNFGRKKNFSSKIYFLPNGDWLQHQRSCQKLGVEGLSNNVLWLSKKCSRLLVTIKVANISIVQHMGGHRLQRQHSCQKLGVEKLSKQCPMTFPTMFQASSVYKSCKWKFSAAYGNYSGSTKNLIFGSW